MTTSIRARLGVIVVTAAAALPSIAFAHHSFSAEFDRSKPVDVTGTVTKVEWMNPHARFYIDAVGKDGKQVHWNFELATPNILMRQGWTRHSLKPGDKVTVKGFRAKLAPNVGSASTVLLADGRTVFGQPKKSSAAQ